jgi:hypothetical protein
VRPPASVEEALELLRSLPASRPAEEAPGAAAAGGAAAAAAAADGAFGAREAERLERLERLLLLLGRAQNAAAGSDAGEAAVEAARAAAAAAGGADVIAWEAEEEARRLIRERALLARPRALEQAPWPVALAAEALAAWAALPGQALRRVVLHALWSLASGR